MWIVPRVSQLLELMAASISSGMGLGFFPGVALKAEK